MKALSLITILFIFTNVRCVSTYYKYEKKPCDVIRDQGANYIKQVLWASGFKDSDIKVTDRYFKVKNRQFDFDNIQKVVVITKKKFIGKDDYYLIVVTKLKDKFRLRTKDKLLAVNAYSAIECFAGIKPRTAEVKSDSSDKYDRLKKAKDLLDSGALTQDEYEAEKAKILNEK